MRSNLGNFLIKKKPINFTMGNQNEGAEAGQINDDKF